MIHGFKVVWFLASGDKCRDSSCQIFWFFTWLIKCLVLYRILLVLISITVIFYSQGRHGLINRMAVVGIQSEDLELQVIGYTYHTWVKHGHISVSTRCSIITYPSHIEYCLEVLESHPRSHTRRHSSAQGSSSSLPFGNPRFCVHGLIWYLQILCQQTNVKFMHSINVHNLGSGFLWKLDLTQIWLSSYEESKGKRNICTALYVWASFCTTNFKQIRKATKA